MMDYQQTIDYLFNSAPLFQQIGGAAYKPGLQTTETLDAHFDHPHRCYKTIHVAGTNGKGTTAHTLAAVLQLAGYRVGLFTSPHLLDFRERIRVNGEMISEQYVIDFVEQERAFFEPLHPSFFELTTAMAFKYFADSKVDVAVIEVGLGGRLDCTNIIRPEMSVITNISLDHTQFLGDTLAAIASEKAGIIKAGITTIIGETHAETRPVFEAQAEKVGTHLVFAEDAPQVIDVQVDADGKKVYTTQDWGTLVSELRGDCQVKNTNTILCALKELSKHFHFSAEHVKEAFARVCELTGLRGRWELIQRHPDVVCDTGHNIGGWQYLAQQLSANAYPKVHVVFGMAADKDIDAVLQLLPQNATYYFTRASVKRSLSETEMMEKASRYQLPGAVYPDVRSAYLAARAQAGDQDLIYIGGSNFIVADFLATCMD